MTSAYLAHYLVHSIVLSLVAGIPMLLLAGCCLPSRRKSAYRLLPWAPLPALLSVAFISSDAKVDVKWFFLGSSMGLDATGRVFLFLTALVWLFASLSVHEKFRSDPRRYRFAGFFLASMSGNLGLILARDILGFYLFFALMSFSAYGLIVHNRTAESARAGRIYLMLVFLSELAMFTALVILAARGDNPSISSIPAGGFSLLLIILLFTAFGVKVGALPFQSWMILSYQQAPAPAATALAGAMVNAGILGWMRFFPFGRVILPDGANFFIILGAAAALYGVIVGLYQDKAGRVLASSSISQMGLVTMIAGYGLLSNEAGRSALTLMTLFAVHHSLAKTSLFLGYDLIGRGGKVIGIFLLAGLLLPCLSLAGFPLTGGAMVKSGMKELAAAGGAPWSLFGKVFLPISSIGTTVLMLHCTRLLWQLNRRSQEDGQTVALPLWAASVAAVAVVPWLWPPLQELGSHTLRAQALFHSLWPVMLGASLSLGWSAARCRLPAGNLMNVDFDFLALSLYTRFLRSLTSVTDFLAGTGAAIKSQRFRQRTFPLFTRTVKPGKWEKVLGRWMVVYLCYLLIGLILFLIMLTAA